MNLTHSGMEKRHIEWGLTLTDLSRALSMVRIKIKLWRTRLKRIVRDGEVIKFSKYEM